MLCCFCRSIIKVLTKCRPVNNNSNPEVLTSSQDVFCCCVLVCFVVWCVVFNCGLLCYAWRCGVLCVARNGGVLWCVVMCLCCAVVS